MAGELVYGMSPLVFTILASAVISLGFALTYRIFGDQAEMRELKKDLKKYRAQMKEHRQDPVKIKELTGKSMAVNKKYMMKSMKPMMITFLPIIFIFGWLRTVLEGFVIIPLAFWPGHLGWLGSYILFSIFFTTFFRKVLKVA